MKLQEYNRIKCRIRDESSKIAVEKRIIKIIILATKAYKAVIPCRWWRSQRKDKAKLFIMVKNDYIDRNKSHFVNKISPRVPKIIYGIMFERSSHFMPCVEVWLCLERWR